MPIKVPMSRRVMSDQAMLPQTAAPRTVTPAEAAPRGRGRRRVDPSAAEHVGIVCVHGIGFQQPGETLLDWTGAIGTALVGWRSRFVDDDLDARDAGWPRDLVENSDVDLTGERPSYVTFRVPGVRSVEGAAPQRWTFTEAYWATKVEPPSLRLLIDWTGREGITGKVVRGILDRNAPEALKSAVHVAGVLWLGLFVSALSSLVLLGYSILRSVLAIIPVQAAKDFVAYGQGERFLVGWWGDARSLVRDPVQSATVRGSLDAAITDLRHRGCTQIVVIAHSGGTIVSYMTLSDPALAATTDTLITHGQAISLGRRLESLEPGADVDHVQVQPSVSRIRMVPSRDLLRVGRWRDFHASHDPAPIDPIEDLVPATARPGDGETEITNFSSIREDHGGYWANDESFVLPVMTEIERAGGGGATSRFSRDGLCDGDEAGVRRRESRVAMRSLWGRLALVGPMVAILLAAGVAGGDIGRATAFDTAGDLLAANYDRLPFSGLGTEVGAWASSTLPTVAQESAVGLTRALFFLFFAIAAVWAIIPVGGWSRMPVGAVLGDFLASATVVVAGWAAVIGLGPIEGIRWEPEYTFVVLVVVVVLAVSYAVHRLYVERRLPPINSTILSCGVAIALIVALIAVGVSFLVEEGTRRWIVDVAATAIVIRLVVRLGMWRWTAWDAAERQWFRGTREAPPSRLAIYAIAVALGALVIAVVAVLGGLEEPLRELGVPLIGYLAPASVVGGALLVLYLIVRDVSIAESARS